MDLSPSGCLRSCATDVMLLTDAELDELGRQAVDFGDERQGMQEIYDAHHEFHLALLAPAATAWDIRILATLWRASERYIRIGFGKLDPEPDEHSRRQRAHTELVAAFRRHDPDVAARAVHDHLARNEQTALRALTDTP